jgi:hypothetical protein
MVFPLRSQLCCEANVKQIFAGSLPFLAYLQTVIHYCEGEGKLGQNSVFHINFSLPVNNLPHCIEENYLHIQSQREFTKSLDEFPTTFNLA